MLRIFYQSSLGNKVDFRDIRNVSPNILTKCYIFKKLRHFFVEERALITTTLIPPCHWTCTLELYKILVPFCLRKKRPENIFLTLILNFCKTVQKKPFLLSKTRINWLFNDIRCYLFIACVNWKIGVFQQRLFRVYYILKRVISSLFLNSFCSDQYILLVTYNTYNSILEFIFLVFCNKVTIRGKYS